MPYAKTTDRRDYTVRETLQPRPVFGEALQSNRFANPCGDCGECKDKRGSSIAVPSTSYRAFRKYGIGGQTANYDGSLTWTTASKLTLVTKDNPLTESVDESVEVGMYRRLAVTDAGPEGQTVSIIRTSDDTVIATYKSESYWKPHCGKAYQLRTQSVFYDDWDPPCAICIEPLITGCETASGIEILSFTGAPGIPQEHFAGIPQTGDWVLNGSGQNVLQNAPFIFKKYGDTSGLLLPEYAASSEEECFFWTEIETDENGTDWQMMVDGGSWFAFGKDGGTSIIAGAIAVDLTWPTNGYNVGVYFDIEAYVPGGSWYAYPNIAG